MSRRILLIGRNGQVGYELSRTLQTLGHVTATDTRDAQIILDLMDRKAIRDTVRAHKPDIIINAAAYTAVDKAEQDADRATAINAVAPGVIAEEAERLGALLVHYSTDYVFNGKHTAPYREDAVTDPQGVYGESKLAGDQAIQDVGGRYLIFRTSWVYGTRGQNFLLTMQRLARERDELRIVADQTGAPTWCRSIAEATAQVLCQLYAPFNLTPVENFGGIYNLTNGGATNWCEFAKAIVATMDNPPRVVPITTAEYPAPAKRPPYSVLDNGKLAQTFGLRLPDWDAALKLCLEQ